MNDTKADADVKISEVYWEVMQVAERLGVKDINQLEKCWELQVNEHWWFAVNGHRATVECSKGINVDPFRLYVEFNGWPAGILTVHGGEFVEGSMGNPEAFMEALRARHE